ETKPSPTPEPTSENSLPDKKVSDTAVAKHDPGAVKPAERKLSSSLFEPIIITIPRPAADKKPAPADKPVPEAPEEKGPESNDLSGAEPARPRIVEGKEITGELLPCGIGVSQESVSLINDGGSIALILSIEE